jgi:hypothetical protein
VLVVKGLLRYDSLNRDTPRQFKLVGANRSSEYEVDAELVLRQEVEYKINLQKVGSGV